MTPSAADEMSVTSSLVRKRASSFDTSRAGGQLNLGLNVQDHR